MNIAELPVAVAGRGIKQHRREFPLPGNGRLEIITPPEIGLPTHEDEAYLIGLLALAKEQGFKERKIYFSPYRLLTQVMKQQHAGPSYHRLTKALRRLQAVSYHCDGSWWDNEKKCRVSVEGAFHLVDRYFLWYNHRDDPTPQDLDAVKNKKAWWQMGGQLWESIQHNFIKQLDTNFFYGLHPLSQKLYRVLDKWFYKHAEIEKPLSEIRVPLGLKDYKYPSEIWRKVKPACDELKEKNFLQNYTRQNQTVKFKKNLFFSTDTTQLELPIPKPEEESAKHLVSYFHTALGREGCQPLEKELSLATNILSTHSLSEAKKIVDFAIDKAEQQGFPMQTLGAIRQYIAGAEAVTNQRQRTEEADRKERERQKQKQARLEQERAEEEKLDQIFSTLPEEEQNKLKAQARQQIIAEHPGKTKGQLKFFLMDYSIILKVHEILKEGGLVSHKTT